MKPSIFTSLSAFFLATLLIAACSKEVDRQPANSAAYLELALNGLVALTTEPAQELQVVVSAVDDNNNTVYSNKKIKLVYHDGLYRSEKITGKPGSYTLTSLLVENAGLLTKYAAPKAGSQKAVLVQQTLPKQYALQASSKAVVHIDVLPVTAGEEATVYGYPAGSFNNPSTGAVDAFTVKVKTAITVGQLEYDYLPATITLTGTKADQSAVVTTLALQPGENAVQLPKEFVQYKLQLSKWGVTDEITIQKADVQEGMLVTLGGSKAAKRLVQEDRFLLVQGTYQADGKTIYTYNPNGTLKQVDYYQKKPQYMDLQLTVVDKFTYGNGKLQRIDRYDGSNTFTGFTDFIYNEAGKIVNMHNKSYDMDTYASVEYGVASGISIVEMDYLYHNGNAMNYKMNFKNGNKSSDVAITSTGGSEGGNYKYDFNINPYAHMNYPDLYLKNLSRNNMIENNKAFGGNIPMTVPYQYEYNYDADGYPAKLEVSYKGFTSGEFLYKIKTQYTYLH